MITGRPGRSGSRKINGKGSKKFAVHPISRKFALDRGTPIDRYYIAKFLKANQEYIHGQVLEVGDNYYTRKYGRERVSKSHVLNIIPSPGTTIVGNLETGENIPGNTFDCFVLTQTIQFIFDVSSALGNAIRALKPGGTLLLTASGISQVWRDPLNSYFEYWRFTDIALKKLLTQFVEEEKVVIKSFGNVAVAKAFLEGWALEEVPKKILDYHDDDYQLLLAARVTKL